MDVLKHTDGILSAVSHHTTLEAAGSGSPPPFCCFSPSQPDLLVTADDSNTFKESVFTHTIYLIFFIDSSFD